MTKLSVNAFSTRIGLLWLLVCALLLAWSISAAHAVPITEILVVTGDSAPDANGNPDGTFNQFLGTILNDNGQVAFTSGLGNGEQGIFGINSNSGDVYQYVREGQTVPGGASDTFGLFFATPSINQAGEIAFSAFLRGGSPSGIFRADGTSSGITTIALEGQLSPDGNGNLGRMFFESVSINDLGEVVFSVLAGSDVSVLRDDGSTLELLARQRTAAPGGGTYGSLRTPHIDPTGAVTFGEFGDPNRFYRVGGPSADTLLLAPGESAPGGNGTYASFNNATYNDVGQLLFNANLSGTSGGNSDDSGLYITNGTSTVQVVREGDPAPDGNGNFASVEQSGLAAPNNAGQAVFIVGLNNTSGGFSDNFGVFYYDGSSVIQIAREDQLTPNSNGRYDNFFIRIGSADVPGIAINDAGQILFYASLRDTSGGTTDNEGLFFYDDVQGIIEIVRKGDSLLGSTITDLTIEPATGALGNQSSALNNAGEVAYQFTLADGRQGVALWAIPEPTTLALLGLGGLFLLRRRSS